MSDARARARRSNQTVVLFLAVAILAPLPLQMYYVGVGVGVGVQALLASGLVLVTGMAGQFSLAQAAFFGVGAYGSALLTVRLGWGAPGAAVAVAVGAMLLAVVLGRPIFRLRGNFLAMATLALTQIMFLLESNLHVTGAASGLGGIQPIKAGPLVLDSLREQWWTIWLIVAAAVWASCHIDRSRAGRALKALRGHEAAAASCGVNVVAAKTGVFAASALIGSVAGSFYAHQILYVNPATFDAFAAVGVLAVAVLGGLRSPWGAVLGAVGYELIRQGVDKILPAVLGERGVGAGQSLVLGAVLVVILVARPDGLAGAAGALGAAAARRWPSSVAPAAPRSGGSATVAERRAPSETSTRRTGRSPSELDRASRQQSGAERHEAGPHALLAHGLVKDFGGVRALDAVDVLLGYDEILAVIGPNGAGKSTLMNVLAGNQSPDAGRVWLGSTELTGLPAHRVAARGLARTFQTPTLFADMTVAENVAVGAHLQEATGLLRGAVPTAAARRAEGRTTAAVDLALRRLDLAHLSDQPATNLSLGQQRLVEVARALVQRPAVILLDEPCAGLNKAEKRGLAEVLRSVRGDGVGLLLIEHDMEFVMGLADRVQVLVFGRVLAVGRPAEVQHDQRVIRAYLGDDPVGVVGTDGPTAGGHA